MRRSSGTAFTSSCSRAQTPQTEELRSRSRAEETGSVWDGGLAGWAELSWGWMEPETTGDRGRDNSGGGGGGGSAIDLEIISQLPAIRLQLQPQPVQLNQLTCSRTAPRAAAGLGRDACWDVGSQVVFHTLIFISFQDISEISLTAERSFHWTAFYVWAVIFYFFNF